MKDVLLKIAVGALLLNALGELALSQIHILASTKIFAREIGIYLFIFIIFGMTTAFNAFLLKKRWGLIIFTLTSLLTVGAGFVYLRIIQADIAAQDALTMADVKSSWLLVVTSIVIYLVGLVVIPVLSWGTFKTSEI